MTDRRPGLSKVPTDQWATRFVNPKGQVRWQPTLPDGRRKWDSLAEPWARPASFFARAPALYRFKWRAERVASSKWRREYGEDKARYRQEFTET